MSRFDGSTYDPEADKERLTRQIERVHALMIDGKWRTLEEIAQATGAPTHSVSARLRDLRKPRFGGYTVNRRHRGAAENGLYEYQVVPGSASAHGKVKATPYRRGLARAAKILLASKDLADAKRRLARELGLI